VTDQASYNDAPISEPSADRFRIDPFAKTLAASIRKLASPEGTVIALNGPWGSGKSSAVNLVVHHLKDAVAADEIVVINFACWWFRGEDALALAFFRELYAGLGPTLGDKFKDALPKLGARLLRAGSMVGPGIDLAGGAGVGTVAAGAMNWLSGLISQGDDTVEKLHAQLKKALSEQKKRFLIIIDDIDRLAPDEALLIFRLVKSAGRLPNVIYLLVFDRRLAEAIVTERFPSEGPHYLEKIIQAGFDLPQAPPDYLHRQLLEQIHAVCGSPPEEKVVRFMNVFYDVIAPEIRTPRDLNRLMNALSVTWPAVGSEVDQADFVGLEAVRLLRPSVYHALRTNKERLAGARMFSGRQTPNKAEYDQIFLSSADAAGQPRLRRALMRLFPPLESVWSNLHYGSDSTAQWERDRRACSSAHFDSYFRFSLGDDTLPMSEIDALIAHAGDSAFVETTFREASKNVRSNGGTKAALLLDELNLHADRVADEHVEPLLKALFRLADELNIGSDKAKAFAIGDNLLRIHWLLRRLTLDRFDLHRRSTLFMAAIEGGSLGWLVDFASSAHRDYHPREGREPEPEQSCLTTSDDAVTLRKMALERLRAAAKTDALLSHQQLPYLLFQWRELTNDEGAEVKQWTAKQLEQDQAVVQFAQALTSHSWSQTAGDMVAMRKINASVNGLEQVVDKDLLRLRVEQLVEKSALDASSKDIIRTFLDAWIRHDKNPRV